MQRYFDLLLACLMALILVVGVAQAQTDPTETEEPTTATETEGTETITKTELEPWVCPEGFEGQTLSVYNWATYIGANTIADFEETCDVSVIYDVYESNEDLIARLRQGNPGYDIAIPSDYAVAIMIRDELLQPIDLDKIPNFANVGEDFKDLPFDPGNQYSVPYLWGTVGIGYNITNVGEEITSWGQIFDYEGRVAWIDDVRVMMSVALLMLGLDPNSTDPADIEAARDYLIANGGNVIALAGDDGDALLAQNEVDIAVEYNGDVFQRITECACEDYVYVVPVEGTIVDIASLVILNDAPNPALAEVFMDYILHPQVSADLTNELFYSTPNQASVDLGLVNEELLANPAVNPPAELRENLFFTQEVGDAEQLYNDAWDEVKILVGQ